jgi:hippurate hydrolase
MADDATINAEVERQLPELVRVYQAFHAAPELSHHERATSEQVSTVLRSLGYTVTDHVGRYANPAWVGYGVVAVLRNGPGPTILVRADMDALPVAEQTGLPYASHVRALDDAGVEVPVMHACGHDLHVTVLLGTARLLVSLRNRWQGTLVLVAQPAEEKGDGARALLADGLYTRFPRPDLAIALHDFGELATGTVGYTSGFMFAGATAVDVTIRGRGGHGAYPQSTKDPIVMAAEFVVALQTIVSREESPLEPAVVSVGSIHGGTKHNIIPDEVHLQLTVRTYKDAVRTRILESIARIAKGIAMIGGVSDDRMPSVIVNDSDYAAPVYNDPALTQRVARALTDALGARNVVELEPVMGGEDFGAYGLAGHEIPTVLFRVGATAPERLDESRAAGTPLPSLHSSLFAPVPEPTLRTGVTAMASVVLSLMQK